MALTKSQLVNQQILTPVRDLVTTELEATEIIPVDKETGLGKYVFLYDYQVTIYNMEAKLLLDVTSLPENSFYTLKYSKGDVVDVVAFGMGYNDKGVPVENKSLLVIKVPKYVKPIGGFKGFSPTITIDNNNGWLQKVAESTPFKNKLGVNFGANINPKFKPVYDNPVTPPNPNPTPTPTPTTETPVVINGVEDTTETKSFFDDKNNLLMIAGVLLIGYLLLNDKSE
jgi:hypothetical protein